jgi:hypothetical protein
MRILMLLALLVLPGAPTGSLGPQESREPRYEKVPLSELIGQAGRTSRANLQLKLTWCGEQTKPIPTVAIGTFGRRLHVKKYEKLRRPRWHYGNDSPECVRFYQISQKQWHSLLRDLGRSGLGDRLNPVSVPPAAKQRWHLVICWTGFFEREVRYAEMFLREDSIGLETAILRAVGGNYPVREELARLLFLR